jgi:hypothetical protein
LNLFPEEVQREIEYLDALVRSDRHQSLPDLLRLWHHYADLLAKRRSMPQDDYAAILFTRDDIQDLLQRASLVTGRVLSALISHDDSVFMSATRHDDTRSFQAAERAERPGWWWDRVPEEFED